MDGTISPVSLFPPQIPQPARRFKSSCLEKCAALFETHVAGKIEHYMGTTALKMGRVVVYNALWLLAHIEQSRPSLTAFFADMVAVSRMLPLKAERLMKLLTKLDTLNIAPEGKQRVAQLILDQIFHAKLSKDELLDLMVFLGAESEKQRSYPKLIQKCFDRLDQLTEENDPPTGPEAYHFLFPILQLCKIDAREDYRISECLWRIANSDSKFSGEELLPLFFALRDYEGQPINPDSRIFSPLIKWLPANLARFTFDECCQLLSLAPLDYELKLRDELFYQMTSRLQNEDCPITPKQVANFLIELRFLKRTMDVDFSQLTPVIVEYWEKEVAQLETMNAQELVEFIKLQYQLINAPYALKHDYSDTDFDNDKISSAMNRRMSALSKQFTLEQIGECLPRLPYSQPEQLKNVCMSEVSDALQSEQSVSCVSMLNILHQTTSPSIYYSWSLPNYEVQPFLPLIKAHALKERSFSGQESAACIGLLLYIYANGQEDDKCDEIAKKLSLPVPLPDFLTSGYRSINFFEEDQTNRAHNFLSKLLPQDHPLRNEVLAIYPSAKLCLRFGSIPF